jgi:uncharacterized protein (TIGR03435 family)
MRAVRIAMRGSRLRTRLERFVDTFALRMSCRRLACTLVLCAALPVNFAAGRLTQSAAPPPETSARDTGVEQASIRRNMSSTALMRCQSLPNNRVVVQNAPVRYLIMTAYDIPPSEISDAPGFGQDAERYDIDVSAPARGESPQIKRQVLQSLLQSRFRLKYHWITLPRPVYEIAVDNSGLRIQRSVSHPNPDAPVPCGLQGIRYDGPSRTLEMKGATMAEFARVFATLGPRDVVDQTGLTGTFDITLRWASCSALAAPRTADSEASLSGPGCNGVPSLLTAVREQLGLRFTPTQRAIQVMVIDNLDRPSEK